MTTPALIDLKALAVRLGMPASRLRREIAAGTIPPPRPLAGRKQLWSAADIDRWLAPPEAGGSDPATEQVDAAIRAAEKAHAIRAAERAQRAGGARG